MQPVVLNEPFRAVFHAPFDIVGARGIFAAQGMEARSDAAALAPRQGLQQPARSLRLPRAAFEQLRGAMQIPAFIAGAPAFEACVDEAIVTLAPRG